MTPILALARVNDWQGYKVLQALNFSDWLYQFLLVLGLQSDRV